MSLVSAPLPPSADGRDPSRAVLVLVGRDARCAADVLAALSGLSVVAEDGAKVVLEGSRRAVAEARLVADELRVPTAPVADAA